MKDHYGREISYLRISVTDRCNLRCRYCMPDKGIKFLPSAELLSFSDIREIARMAVALGISKIKLTGGEPLVRPKIATLVKMLSEIPGLSDLSITTNGVLLAEHSRALAEAGLNRINISLDTIRGEKYKEITGGSDIGAVFRGIEQARKVGLDPIKINCVVQNSSNDEDAQEVAKFCRDNSLQVRFIKKMDWASGEFSVVDGGNGGDCPRCNRIRLSANGIFKPCLFSDIEYDVRKSGPFQAFVKSVKNKPECGGPCSENWVRFMGG